MAEGQLPIPELVPTRRAAQILDRSPATLKCVQHSTYGSLQVIFWGHRSVTTGRVKGKRVKLWLPPRDSNPDMLIQSQLSYH